MVQRLLYLVLFVSMHSVGILSEPSVKNPLFGAAPNMTKVQVDSPAFLHCPVFDLSEENQVSWVRRRDWHIMSNGEQIFTSDDRVSVKHHVSQSDWVLQIKYVQQRDSGLYECQVNVVDGSMMSRKVQLEVVTPEAIILGKEEYHIQKGSLISLICILENTLVPPEYVFWFQNERMINFDNDRDVTVQTTTGRKTSSKLNIQRAKLEHSGNYTCQPSSGTPASIQVFVLGDKTGALINGHEWPTISLLLSVFSCLLYILI